MFVKVDDKRHKIDRFILCKQNRFTLLNSTHLTKGLTLVLSHFHFLILAVWVCISVYPRANCFSVVLCPLFLLSSSASSSSALYGDSVFLLWLLGLCLYWYWRFIFLRHRLFALLLLLFRLFGLLLRCCCAPRAIRS